MAWIVKDSANAKVERRDEPYLTDEMKREAERTYFPRYETKQGALLPVLHMIQHAYHWIPPQALIEVGEFLGLAPADVLDTASFYEEYWLKPRGTHCIAVCRSIACEFCDHQALTDAVRERLDIELGETTDDGKFTLVELECMGACGEAPVALVDEELKKYCTPEDLVKAIDELDG
jgi:NADH:ubiquinone oxidoreductase subunit E